MNRVFDRLGFSLMEIVIAIAILALAFVPILSYTQSSVRGTRSSQEDILAQHYLMDLVERFKSSSLEELSEFPAAEPKTPLGRENEQALIREDPGLSEKEKFGLQRPGQGKTATTTATGVPDDKVRFLLEQVAMLRLTRAVTFAPVPDVGAPGVKVYRLRCIVRWLSRGTGAEKRIQFAKILAF